LSAGVHRTVLAFAFAEGFKIGRWLELDVCASGLEGLRAETPYVPPPRARRGVDAAAVDRERFEAGPRAVVVSGATWTPPKAHKVPPHLYAQQEAGPAREQLEQSLLAPPLCARTYTLRFQTLLWLEELQMAADITAFDQPTATLTPPAGGARGGGGGPNGGAAALCFGLAVPGLVENRPSIVRGDSIMVRRSWNADQLWEGVVQGVERDVALLRFAPAFERSYVSGEPVSVRFTFGRMHLRVMHGCLQYVGEVVDPNLMGKLVRSFGGGPKLAPLRRLLFPTTDDLAGVAVRGRAGSAECARALHSTADLNDEQRQAVEQLASLQGHAPPFIIFGPPGTVSCARRGRCARAPRASRGFALPRCFHTRKPRVLSTIHHSPCSASHHPSNRM
jgi:helicase MOV-10